MSVCLLTPPSRSCMRLRTTHPDLPHVGGLVLRTEHWEGRLIEDLSNRVEGSGARRGCLWCEPPSALRFPSDAGLQLWKRNLQLLVPFLIRPRLDLLSLQRAGRDEESALLLVVRFCGEVWTGL